MQTLLITPGSPWKNGSIESINERLRDERLDTPWEVTVVMERWRHTDNGIRPHSTLMVSYAGAIAKAAIRLTHMAASTTTGATGQYWLSCLPNSGSRRCRIRNTSRDRINAPSPTDLIMKSYAPTSSFPRHPAPLQMGSCRHSHHADRSWHTCFNASRPTHAWQLHIELDKIGKVVLKPLHQRFT